MAKSVMIVDDSEIIRRNLYRLFEGNGDWTVCAEAVDGRDALEKAQKFHPDFIVLDFFMPSMDGLEVAPQLKGITPNSPIVMLTAFKDRYVEERAYKAGVSWVLSKTTDDLRKVLDFARILLAPDPVESAQAGAPESAGMGVGITTESLEVTPQHSRTDWKRATSGIN